LPRSFYEGGKKRRHFTLSDQAHDHLCRLAQEAGISKSETIERIVRCQHISEGRFTLSDEVWPEVTDFSFSSHETL
jgi:hypothetical protein